jgi:hypothetical protein
MPDESLRKSPSGKEVAISSGPATQLNADGDILDINSIVDGEFLKRDGTTIISAAVGAGAVDSVFGRTGAITATTGDYDSSQVDNDSNVPGASVTEALNELYSANTPLETAGAELGDASVTISTTVRQVMLEATLTADRTLTITPSVTPYESYPIEIGTQGAGLDVTITNGGLAGGSVVVAGGTRRAVWILSDGANVTFTITKLGAEPTL